METFSITESLFAVLTKPHHTYSIWRIEQGHCSGWFKVFSRKNWIKSWWKEN